MKLLLKLDPLLFILLFVNCKKEKIQEQNPNTFAFYLANQGKNIF